MPEFRRELVELLPRLRRFASVLTRSHDDAEDVVQAAVERALRHADSWQQGSRLDSWLYKIMQNLWRDELRAHRRRAEPLESHADIAGADGRDVTIRHIQSNEARQALEELPEDQRVVIALVVLEGMSYQQAADILEVPVGTVMSRLARARARLAASLGEGPQRVRAAK
ncbi:MAG TPA: RNA polymerase sigma factor [Steroidobacteraceae bacterium]|jgi:RNA polymerase sigma factor, sigma-70 family|nr:RNA polymerase sigma factor [Steroidobacteraceae bacterium]